MLDSQTMRVVLILACKQNLAVISTKVLNIIAVKYENLDLATNLSECGTIISTIVPPVSKVVRWGIYTYVCNSHLHLF